MTCGMLMQSVSQLTDGTGWFILQLGMYTRNTGAQSDKSNGIDRILEENEAAQMSRHIPDDGSHQTDHED